MELSLKQRAIVFFVVVAGALAFLAPTLSRENFSGGWISKPLSLGLDLSGGVHLVYEVKTAEAVKGRLQGMISALRSDLRNAKIAVTRAKLNERGELEITLLNSKFSQAAKDKIAGTYKELGFVTERAEGDRVTLAYGFSQAQSDRIERESVDQAIENLRGRVDQFGVSEPTIQRIGEKRILLQMPGVSDIDAVKKVVGSVAKLEFRLVPRGDYQGDKLTFKDKQTGGPISLEEEALMSGDAVADARVGIHDAQVEVSLKLTSEGAVTFAKITSENVGRNLAIMLDGLVYSSPVIREAIRGGQASISGGFSMEEAKQLAVILRAGALPAPLEVMEERTVGPTLGADSIRAAVRAIAVGAAFVFVFMAIYYAKAGLVAVGVLLLNLLLILAGLSAFGATLTLPGLAGLALTVGMAVDSNVIIFERIKDEVRNGSTRDAAVNAGFHKALSAILDSNLMTLFSGMILYWLGTGPIRGFAVTLCVGIVTTVFCAVFVTRLAFDFLSLKGRNVISI